MRSARRDFLRSMAAVAGGSLVGATRLSAQGGPSPTSAAWDMTWRDRLTGPFRAVFDSPDVAEGAGLWRAAIWKDEVAEVYGVDRGVIHSVLVVRHHAIPMVMNHDFWTRHSLGKKLKLDDPGTGKRAARNPYLSATNTAAPQASGDDVSLDRFLAGGGIVLGCNFAFGRMVSMEREAEKGLSQADARTRALSYLVSGVILQPSGFFAALEAQRGGCAYFPATM